MRKVALVKVAGAVGVALIVGSGAAVGQTGYARIAQVPETASPRVEAADEAEAKKRGVPVEIVVLERRVASLEKENKILSEELAGVLSPAPQNGGNRLYDAVAAGDIAAVKALAKSSPDLLEVPGGRVGQTPLIAAISAGNKEITGILVDAGANVNNSANGFPPLLAAVGRQYREIAELLLAHKADVNAANPNGATVLDSAIIEGKKEWVVFLLDHGASMAVKDKQGGTPMDYARTFDKPELIDLLESKGAKADIFVWTYRGDMEKVKDALKEDPKLIDAKDWQGQTMLAITVRMNRPEWIDFLLDAGADVNAQDRGGFTPLQTAAGMRQEKAVQRLLDKGADVKVKDRLGRTVIHLAADSPAIIALFAKRGVELNAQDNAGKTAIYWMVEQNNAKAVKALVELGADLNIKDNKGKTPLALTMERGGGEMAELLRAHGAKE